MNSSQDIVTDNESFIRISTLDLDIILIKLLQPIRKQNNNTTTN